MTRRPLTTRPRRLLAESLETRRLLAIAVTGTAAADVIRIAADGALILVVLNAVESRYASDVEGIVVNAGDGADTIRLDDASNLPVTINGEGADDRIEVGAGDVRAARLFGVNVVGGAGNDALVVNDATAATGNPSVTFDNPIDTYVSIIAAPGSLIRSDAGNAATAVETITYTGTSQGDRVDVKGTSALATVFVNGANGNDTMTVGQDLDTKLKGPVTLDGQVGADVLTIDDSLDTSADTYFVGGTASVGTVRKNSGGSTASFAGFGNVTLIAGLAGSVPNFQIFRVASLPDAINTTILAGDGNDTLTLGDGVTLDTFKSNLTFDGGADEDLVNYNDVIGTDAAAYAVTPSTVTNTGTATLNFTNSEDVLVTANGANNDLRIISTTPDLSVTLSGGAGNDTVHIGNGDFDASILDGVSVQGGSGTDVLLIEDAADDLGNDTYIFGTDSAVQFGTMTKGTAAMFWSTAAATRVETISLLASANSDTIRINAATPAIKFNIDAGDGNDSFFIASTTEGNSTATAVSIVSGAGNDSLDINSDNAGTDALIAFTSPTEDVNDLRIRAGGRVTMASGAAGVLAVRGLLAVGGRIDLADATMVVSGGDYPAMDALVTIGFSGGAWNGGASTAAIVSSVAAASVANDAIGVVRAADLALPIFGTFLTGSTDVIIRYTTMGDANLDRVVDFNDLTSLAQNYGLTGLTWAQGDFSYDPAGNVDFDDLVILAQNYQQTPVPVSATKAKKRTG